MGKITSLLILISSAVLSACALTLFFVYQFGPTGTYQLQNALISPELIPILSFNAPNPATGGQTRFGFDQLLFIHLNNTRVVSVAQYQEFYSLVKADKSLQEGAESLFIHTNPSRLVIGIRSGEQKQTFQEVEFAAEGNYYRVMLRQELTANGQWAYYYHPQIETLALKIFAQ